jgi:hypothetical protein
MRLPVFILSLIILVIMSGCSTGLKSPSNCNIDTFLQTSELPIFTDKDETHNLIGTFTMSIDVSTLTASCDYDRSASTHYNVTSLIPLPIIQVNSWNPSTQIVDVDLLINNPYFLDVYDVKLIVYTDEFGHKLVNFDDWTSLYDIPQGLPINPFLAYGKEFPSRKFSGNSYLNGNLKIYCPGNNFTIRFAVDASYPGNCEEPYSIGVISQDSLYDQIKSASDIRIKVLDWQNDVNSVYLYCPLITGVSLVPFVQIDPERWKLTIENHGAPPGNYDSYLIAMSAGSGSLALYDQLNIQIQHLTAPGWIGTWGGPGYDHIYAIEPDSSGSIYVAGYFSGTSDLDPTKATLEYTSNGGMDCYLSRFNPDGSLNWAKAWGSDKDDFCTAVVRGIADDIYIAGIFQSTVDFNPGLNIESRTATGICDVFLSKFSLNGDFQWVRTWGGPLTGSNPIEDFASSLDCDNSGNLCIGGYFTSTVDFDPGAGIAEYTADSSESYVSIFSPDGNFIRVHVIASASSESQCENAAIDQSGNLYFSGSFRGQIDVDTGPGECLLTSWNEISIYLTKYTNSGNFIWGKTWGPQQHSTYQIGAYDIVFDSDSNLYIPGCFASAVDFDPGVNQENRTSNGKWDAYLLKLTSGGEFIRVDCWGNTDKEVASGACIDSSDNIFIIGNYKGTSDMDPGPGSDEYISTGYGDVFLSKFNAYGNQIWTHVFCGDEDTWDEIIALDSNENPITAGTFSGTVDFDPSVNFIYETSAGQTDAFIVKLQENGYLF